MIYSLSATNDFFPSWPQIQYAIMRNFGGLDGMDPIKVFKDNLHGKIKIEVINKRTLHTSIRVHKKNHKYTFFIN